MLKGTTVATSNCQVFIHDYRIHANVLPTTKLNTDIIDIRTIEDTQI